MIVGVGIDIESINTVKTKKALHQSSAFFTDQELLYCKNRWNSLTALICVKESCIKALSNVYGFPKYLYKDIELCHEKSGKPYIRFHGNLEQFLLSQHLDANVSITHTSEIASAIVIFYKKDKYE